MFDICQYNNQTQLSELSLKTKHTYPIVSRCGVFSKTDIQNLISKNVCKEDIALSILHVVAVQTITTLSHGTKLKGAILSRHTTPRTATGISNKLLDKYLYLGKALIRTNESGRFNEHDMPLRR